MFGTNSSLGAIASFDHLTQDWKLYKGRLQQWFIAYGVGEAQADKTGVKQKAVLLSALTESTYQLACNLALPHDINAKSYEEIVKLLDDHFLPKRCTFAERHKFYAAVQQPGETHSQWAARLRGLASYCAFKNIEDQLLDKFVMGMLPGSEREKLFGTNIDQLTLSKAVDMAESIRCARAGANTAPVGYSNANQDADGAVFKINQGNSNKGPRYSTGEKCSVCGYKSHKSSECRFINYKCKLCNQKGHLRKMCTNKKVNYVEQGNTDDEEDDGELLLNINCHSEVPMTETVNLEGRNIKCEIDSGSPVSVISESLYKSHFSEIPLSVPTKNLLTYTSTKMAVTGCMHINVTYLGRTVKLPFHVICNGGPPLLGRDFMKAFQLHLVSTLDRCCNIMSDVNNNVIETLTNLYPGVFADKLGCFTKFEIKLPLKSDAQPIFFKSRSVPFALKDKVNKELDRLQALGILKPVSYSEYASPIVPVLKKDGTVRICADYSVTINKQLLVEKYPLPTSQELFTKLHGGEEFSKLDLSMAYNQIKIHESSQNITCINTQKGLYNYSRLIFGLASSASIFQRVIDSLLGNLDGVLVFQDDVCITGSNKAQHMTRLKEVLKRLEEAGFTLRRDKCKFFQREISYLGYIIDKNGIRKDPSKIDAILQATVPKTVTELQSFLGLINYYRNFTPNASSILSPMHELLKKDCKWHWGSEQDKSFEEVKKILSSDKILAHFDNNAKIILTVDASPVGLGAILSQVGISGVEQPISYASRSLTVAEKKYSQIQKEATAIIFGVRKFHQYLYGRSEPFTLRTDHKPLTVIFGAKRGIPEVSANRLQRYAIFLSAYNYKIEFISSAANTADFLSRALPNNSSGPWPRGTEGREVAAYVNFALEGCLPVTAKDLENEILKDPVLCKVSRFIQNGWPPKMKDENLKPYFLCRMQLSLENGILMRGHKVVVPSALRNKVLNELHSSHFGIVKMKAEARSRFWFPGIDKALENLVGACNVCVQLRPSPPRSPLAPWPHPPHAFHRIHMDFLGPMNNKMFLIIVDAYSKWVECYNMNNNITTKAVICKLCDFMSRFGIPQIIVTDNGTSFTSQELANFCKLNNISQLFSPVYHAMSNGQAESFVKIIKKGINSILLSGSKDDFQNRLSKYLFDYRNSCNSTTETSPAELVFGRKLHSRLDLFAPSTAKPTSSSELPALIRQKQCLQAKHFGGITQCDFNVGDTVWFKNFVNKNKYMWSKGQIIGKFGKVMYKIKSLGIEKCIIRHRNQLRTYKANDAADCAIADVCDVALPQDGRDVPYSWSSDSGSPSSSPEPEDAPAGSPHNSSSEGHATGEVEESVSTDVDTIHGSDSAPSGSGTPRTPSHSTVVYSSPAGTQSSSSSSTAPSSPTVFSTPQPHPAVNDDNDDHPHTPEPGRSRRNRPIVDYKKYL